MFSMLSDKPLTQAKLEKLERFLEKYDLPDLCTLHGFLSAIVSGPNLIMPSEWIDFLDLNQGEYESIEEAQEIIGCIMTIYNNILHQFQAQNFQIMDPALNGKDRFDISTAKSLWAKGYMIGVSYDKKSWLKNDEMAILLFPIASSLGMENKELQEMMAFKDTELNSEKMREYSEEKLSELANAIYQYWLERRDPEADMNRRQTRASKIQISRNDPCPCGSGKKFKKCCLN